MSSTPPVDLQTSVAGEEDPGASNDIGSARTPADGEGICPDCGGSGAVAGNRCPRCGGTGTVMEDRGGA
ncbi:hypothetical protein [Ramlibacter sp. PS4R-6]|uniref:hypothetical protein n=1 Tax=Ramlibacter sp. PS4R-6 TaxID=3133438 RepID=UPI0030AF96B8